MSMISTTWLLPFFALLLHNIRPSLCYTSDELLCAACTSILNEFSSACADCSDFGKTFDKFEHFCSTPTRWASHAVVVTPPSLFGDGAKVGIQHISAATATREQRLDSRDFAIAKRALVEMCDHLMATAEDALAAAVAKDKMSGRELHFHICVEEVEVCPREIVHEDL
mmetsp:Transcript_4215/g.8326  ORF Transcript_4215/g.8326 Transcript_4215/m.8326 type:complete len:168 (-) Transcript_4215:595-1098(-)